MVYVQGNPKSKKALKEMVASGESVYAFFPGIGGFKPGENEIALEGPHAPMPHKWYARAIVDSTGKIIRLIA